MAKTSVFFAAMVGAVPVVVVVAGSEQRELFRPVMVSVSALIAVLSLNG